MQLQIPHAEIALFVSLDNTDELLAMQLQIQHAEIVPFVSLDNTKQPLATQPQIQPAEIVPCVLLDNTKSPLVTRLQIQHAAIAQSARMDSTRKFLAIPPSPAHAHNAATVLLTNRLNSHAMQHMILFVFHVLNVPIALIQTLIYQTMDSIAHATMVILRTVKVCANQLLVAKIAIHVASMHL
jgi:hypothetical protein